MSRYFNLTYQAVLGAFFLFATYRVPVDLYPFFLSAFDDVAAVLCSSLCFTAAMVCGIRFARTLRALRKQPLPSNE